MTAERCDHDHSTSTDPLFSVFAHLRTAPDGGPMLHITLEHCPHLGDAELVAIAGALGRTLAELASAARADIAGRN